MNAPSHIAVALAAALVASSAVNIDPVTPMMIAAAAALVPDIDHPNSTINRRLFVTRLAGLLVGHRGMTHSVFAVGAVAAAAVWAGGWPAYAAALGYASHVLLDMTTRAGVPVFAPVWRRRFHLVPGPLRLVSGSWHELLVIIICAAVAISSTV